MEAPGFADFAFDIKAKLESDRVTLVAWNPAAHAELLYKATGRCPEVFDYIPWGPYASAEEVEKSLASWIDDQTKCLYAIYVKAGVVDRDGNTHDEPSFAGTIGLLNAIHHEAAAEIGAVVILPQWQRTCVATHANGLLLHELLDPLPPFGNGLGLRRAQWQCHADNLASQKAAKRLGFVLEGVTRWSRVLLPGKPGEIVTGEGRMFGQERKARHSCMFAICWDDWESGGVREKVDAMMKR